MIGADALSVEQSDSISLPEFMDVQFDIRDNVTDGV